MRVLTILTRRLNWCFFSVFSIIRIPGRTPATCIPPKRCKPAVPTRSKPRYASRGNGTTDLAVSKTDPCLTEVGGHALSDFRYLDMWRWLRKILLHGHIRFYIHQRSRRRYYKASFHQYQATHCRKTAEIYLGVKLIWRVAHWFWVMFNNLSVPFLSV